MQCGLKHNQDKVSMLASGTLEMREAYQPRVGCEQCGLRRKLLGPGLGGSCTPPHKSLKSVANDAFSTRFDDGLGWGSIPGILGKEGGLPAKGLDAKRPASNAVIGPRAWRIMDPTAQMAKTIR